MSKTSLRASIPVAISGTKKYSSQSVDTAFTAVIVTVGRGVCRIRLLLNSATSSISQIVDGGIVDAIPRRMLMPWVLVGWPRLISLALAIVLLGKIARSLLAVTICVARQFISTM